MKPWLSVVMPVHQGERYLAATLASAAAERPEGVEFLIYESGADNGASRRIAETFSGQLAISWHDTPDLGPWTAKTNRGVEQASARHVAMLHQDDLWLPGHLAAIRRTIATSPEAALSIGPSLFIGPDGQPLGKWRLPFSPGIHHEGIVDTLLVQNSVAVPSVVMRRDAFLEVGGMDHSLWYTADWDLYLKLARSGSVAVRGEFTTAFRLHRQSQTMAGSRNRLEFRHQQERVLESHMAPTFPRSRQTDRCAHASITVNCALASAANGKPGALVGAFLSLLKLGPIGLARYVRQSRLVDRLFPRLRLTLVGAM